MYIDLLNVLSSVKNEWPSGIRADGVPEKHAHILLLMPVFCGKGSRRRAILVLGVGLGTPFEDTPIERTLQQFERNAKAWYDLTRNQPYAEAIAYFANLHVKETIEETRKAVKDMAWLLFYARIFIEENCLEKAKVNIEAALELLESDKFELTA
ncbi:hypothetical protein VB005_04337 [Metarhizium brunneum]